MSFDSDGDNLFQILISDGQHQDFRNIPILRANRKSFEMLHPELRYALLDNDEIRSVIGTHLGTQVLDTYDAIVPYAYKADLGRYCLLYVFGGMYADLSMRLLAKLTLAPEKELLVFRDAYCNAGSSWAVSNGLIRARPRRPEFMTAIEQIVQNHRHLYYGPSPLHPTGPALFGRAIALVNHGEEIEVGELRNLTGSTHPLSYGYVDGLGRLVCMRMKEDGGDLALMGVTGVNMYDTAWRQRSIYGEPLLFHHSDERLRLHTGIRTENGIEITPEMQGCIVFGPYVYASAGRYRGTYKFDGDLIGSGITLDVVANGGLVAESRSEILEPNHTASVDFELDRRSSDLQIRLIAHGGCEGRCVGLRLEHLRSG